MIFMTPERGTSDRPMDFDGLLEQAERDPEDGNLIAALLVQHARLDPDSLSEYQQERLYNLLAYVFTNLEGGSHNALHAALQRALIQPAVLEYFERRMRESGDFSAMLETNPAAPVILALLCSHDDPEIAHKAALALAYTGSTLAYHMLQRWMSDVTNKKLYHAAELALPYFDHAD